MRDEDRISGLAMIHDADGGPPGETRYLVRHLFGRNSCSLTVISHRGSRRKPEFEQLLADLPVPVDVLYRNEQDIGLRSTTAGLLPCVMAHVDGRWEEVVDRDRLASCDGDVGAFRDALEAAIDGRVERRHGRAGE